ncbi:hypothetical protein SAMN02745704_00101 [Paucidesulfovibrio gracilis DSM 16080]|uniref:Nucleoside 2-deoxyribosyltransferase n=1 Tax=Paucidesulfovibrio gracilis DSM 16080 TaxID=1121449 RepID=A0A1T4W260_9BACT|nr:hypothetical protein [Paucidesulfovibrio gracilis]SKA71229.1 hypothetical protein SAMN02745704_00101 [Paucidesulfovibrio gracilis DSM 16080]
MFNLMMFNVDWESGRVQVPLGRVFEYTEDSLVNMYKENGALQLDLLKSLPCLFCEEGTRQESAYVGRIVQARLAGDALALEVAFDRDVPVLQNEMLYENRIDLDMPHDFEFSRNHWAVKNVDLYRFLLRNVRPRRQRPTVFELPEHERIDASLLSAMMPFDAGFREVHEVINQASEDAGLRCRRVDDIWEAPSIIQDVVSLIDRSRVVVCDCTGKNPNVFYEVGIAHTLGRDVVLVTQNEYDIPFDLRHIRYIKYLNNGEGLLKLRHKLANRIRTIVGH